MELLKERHICSSSRTSHKDCYMAFTEYLSSDELVYSDDVVKQWLSSIKDAYSWQKCYFWKQYMTQLAEVVSTGTISDRNLYLIRPTYKKIPDTLRLRLDEYLNSCLDKYSKRSWELTRIFCSDVMLFFSNRGLMEIEKITYQDIVSLYNADLFCTDDTRSMILGHASRMMSFFSLKGLCNRGYSMLLDNQIYPHVGALTEFSEDHRTAIEQFCMQNIDFSADEFYDSINGFISMMKDQGYVGTTLRLARHSLTALYLFLEIHKLGYLPEIIWIWFAEVKNVLGSSWKQWRRVLRCYEEYAETGDILPTKKYRYKPSSLETFPEWCRKPIFAFLNQKLKKYRSTETIRTSQYPCIRFCRYLIKCGISAFVDVTPAIINEFSRTDQHGTFKGRSSYFTVIRQFLEYLEEKEFIYNKSLHNSLSAGTAPVEKIVDVLTDEQVSMINKYRLLNNQPIELRNAALVMVGLKMGLRTSDVVNLKLSDIDWKKRQITIIQQKTQVQLTLPMPVDVGNSIYAYIRNGRPKSNNIHVFIRHNAPYGKLTTKNCTIALHSILPERKSVKGGGFHVTRRTFATCLLKNNAGIGTVMDSLGHQDNSSVMKYLSLDEERIHACALSLSDTGLVLKEGALL